MNQEQTQKEEIPKGEIPKGDIPTEETLRSKLVPAEDIEYMYRWEAGRSKRAIRTRQWLDRIDAKNRMPGTRIRCPLNDVLKDLEVPDIETRNFFVTLTANMDSLQKHGYPKIVAHKIMGRTTHDQELIEVELEWVTEKVRQFTAKCREVTAEDIALEQTEEAERERLDALEKEVIRDKSGTIAKIKTTVAGKEMLFSRSTESPAAWRSLIKHYVDQGIPEMKETAKGPEGEIKYDVIDFDGAKHPWETITNPDTKSELLNIGKELGLPSGSTIDLQHPDERVKTRLQEFSWIF